eukprot:CAMPEP_0197251570 /NCGR_PEP_ID=MMETSP1429-20130617/57686_1 /TAXON_ID=49237 /ORGANISM="Chaetoceros  sp., Strain UNC1202" /LENGTH=51 /DNA_ID=CAMNT_0042713687 /DNA_START=64 /DNA_END=215 /DNA_ORIENTATION=-
MADTHLCSSQRFWDTKNNLPRWFETNTNVIMGIPNRMGGHAIYVPVTEKVV